MLKKRLGIEAIEKDSWGVIGYSRVGLYFKIPSTLVIPDGCKWVGDWAFWRCKKLRKVVIPESVEIIEPNAFAWCVKLEKVVIPEGVKEIMVGAFRECKKAEITLYTSRAKLNIGESVFWNCKCVRYVEKETRN